MTNPSPRGHGEKLSRRRDAAISALLSCGTLREAAASCGVAESTLRRWKALPSFQEDLELTKRQLFDGAMNRLRSVAWGSVGTLDDISKDTSSPAAARVSAGRAVLELLLKAVEVQDLAHRLDAIEAELKASER